MSERIVMPEVIREVARRMNCSQGDAKEVLEHFSDVIAENLAKGEEVGFKPLGVFTTAKARNKTIILFRPSVTILRKLGQTANEGA